MRATRLDLYRQLEEIRESKLFLYSTSDRPGMETQIAPDILRHFIDHLDLIGKVNRISLFLYTRGGSTLAAWSLVNLLRNFCDELEVIVPFHCHSAGTLICLGANQIIMTKQANLGPIDPSTNNLMNPQVTVNGQIQRVPVSVEFVNGYLELVQSELGIKSEDNLSEIVRDLAGKIHPLALGEVYRSRSQITMLAHKLLKHQALEKEQEDEIIKFLCSDSGSHDYTIFRKEARDELGLKIVKPDDKLYALIKATYDDLAQELEFSTPFDTRILLGGNSQLAYRARRSLIESLAGGTHVFTSEGSLFQTNLPAQNGGTQTIFHDRRNFEGWKHETV